MYSDITTSCGAAALLGLLVSDYEGATIILNVGIYK
jgi:hypothetical protein